MNKNFIISGVIIFVIFVVGLLWLAQEDAKTTSNEDQEIVATFEQYATELGLDIEKFRADYQGEEARRHIAKDVEDANRLGVNATPTLMIDNKKLEYQTVEDIKGAIDAKIAENVVQEITDPEHTKGSENPKVIIVEFSDFQCPACAGFTPFMEQVLNDYPENVALQYRHFPLDMIHPYADAAARAAEAAAAQGKFWEMHDLLFERQQDWS